LPGEHGYQAARAADIAMAIARERAMRAGDESPDSGGDDAFPQCLSRHSIWILCVGDSGHGSSAVALARVSFVEGKRHCLPEAKNALFLAADASPWILRLGVRGFRRSHAEGVGLMRRAVQLQRRGAAPRSVRFRESRVSFPRAPNESGHKFHDCRVKVGICGAAVDVVSRQGETGTGGELLSVGCAVMPAEHDVRCQRSADESRHFRKLHAHEIAQCRAKAEMMRRDVNW
jgi:hypothetical protein